MTVWHVGAFIEDLYLQVPRLPREGESLTISQMDRSPGGKAANQAFATARLGTECQLVAAVGADDAAQRGLSQLASAGVGLDNILQVDAPTDQSTIVLDDSASQFILTWAGAGAELSSSHVLQALAQVGAQDFISMQGEVDPAIAVSVMQFAQDRAQVVLNPSPVDGFTAPDFPWHLVDYLVVNETEAAVLTGLSASMEPHIILRQLAKVTGVSRCVLTLGERGAVCLDGADYSHFAAPQVQAVDPTGAGDGFTAGLIHTLAQGGSLAQGCAFGVLLGAYATEHKHCFPGYPTPDQLGQWVDRVGGELPN